MQALAPASTFPAEVFPDVREVGASFRPDLASIAMCSRLAKARMGLSIPAQRLFVLAVAAIRIGDTELKPLRIDQAVYGRVFHPERAHHGLKRDLVAAVQGLTAGRAELTAADGGTSLHLVAYARYVPGEHSCDGKPHVLLQLHSALAPYLLNLSAPFTKVPFPALLGFGSRYALPLLLLLRARSGGLAASTTKLRLADLRFTLGVTGYKDRSDFAKRVLKPARDELRLRNVMVSFRFVGSGVATEVEFRTNFGDLATFDPAEGPKASALRLADSVGFKGSLDPWAIEHGWERVEAEVGRVVAFIESRPPGKRIQKPGAYLRSSLDALDAEPTRAAESGGLEPMPEVVSAAPILQAGPAPIVGSKFVVVQELVRRLEEARHAHLVTRFGDLAPERQQGFKDMARQALHKQYIQPDDLERFIDGRALRLFDESEPNNYPTELRSVESYVAHFRPLDHLDPETVEAVIRDARSTFATD